MSGILMACQSANKQREQIIVVKESDVCRKVLSVDGMNCVGCEVTLEEKLSKIEGVVAVRASHKTNQVRIEFDSTKTDMRTIKSVITQSGYKVLDK